MQLVTVNFHDYSLFHATIYAYLCCICAIEQLCGSPCLDIYICMHKFSFIIELSMYWPKSTYDTQPFNIVTDLLFSMSIINQKLF